MPAESEEIIELLKNQVQIDSSNPWLIPGSTGEGKLGEFINDWLTPLGMDITLEEVEPTRRNLIAKLKGTGGGKSLCLNAHLDTVGYTLWKDRALKPIVQGDHLIGLGSADDKGHCAAVMLALKSIIESNVRLRGDIWIVLTIDEEGTSIGTMHYVKSYQPDAVIVFEPVGLSNIIITHQGFGWLDLIVKGRAAHGCAPEIGIDAIVHMAEVIKRLHELDQSKYTPTRHPLNGKTVFHTGTISGGTDYATYPGSCCLGIEIGTQPGETIEDRLAEIRSIYEDVKRSHPNFEADVEIRLARNPFEATGHEVLLQILSAEVEKETHQPVKPAGANVWADAALFQEAGIPTLMMGAQGANFHAPDEWVSIPELTKLVRIKKNTALTFCA